MLTPADNKYFEIYRRVIEKYPGLAPRRFEPAIWLGDGPPTTRREMREGVIKHELEKELAQVLSNILAKQGGYHVPCGRSFKP